MEPHRILTPQTQQVRATFVHDPLVHAALVKVAAVLADIRSVLQAMEAAGDSGAHSAVHTIARSLKDARELAAMDADPVVLEAERLSDDAGI